MKMCVFDKKKKCVVQKILIDHFEVKTIVNRPSFITDYCGACLAYQNLVRLSTLEKFVKRNINKLPGE